MVLPRARACILFLGLLALALGVMASTADAQTPPPATGDWVVEDVTTVAGVSIILEGGVTVTSTGRLTLIDVDLALTCSTWTPEILVEGSGELSIEDRDGDPASESDASHVGNLDPTSVCALTFLGGSKGLVSCSVLTGVRVEAYSADLTITGSVIEESRDAAVTASGCDLTVERTRFVHNFPWGVRASGGSMTMDRCSFNDSVGRGVVLESGVDASIRNCTFLRATFFGIEATGSTLRLEDCDLSGSLIGIGLYEGMDCEIRRCNVHDHTETRGYGLYASGVDRLLVSSCWFYKNHGYGASLSGNATLESCTLERCHNGIAIGEGSVSVRGCALSWNHNGIVVQNAGGGEAVLEECTLNGSAFDGVMVEGLGATAAKASFRNCTISECGRDGVYVAGSSVKMDRCTVRRCGSSSVVLASGSTALLANCSIGDCNLAGVSASASKAVLEDCDITDARTGCELLDVPGGAVRRCSFSGMLNAGLVAVSTGRLVVSGCTFKGGTGVALEGTVDCEDGLFDGCARGAMVGNGSIGLSRCRFESNQVGAWVRATGVEAPVLEGCTFDRCRDYGVLVGEGGRCALIDVRIIGSGGYGVFCSMDGAVEWRVESRSCATNGTSVLRGNVTVIPWSTLELTNASLTFLTDAGALYGVSVVGGTFVLSDLDGDPSTPQDGCSIGAEDMDWQSTDPSAFVSVSDGGRLDARCTRFLTTPITVRGARCALQECTISGLLDVGLSIEDASGPSTVDGCSFFALYTCALARNSGLEVVDCLFYGCVVGIDASSCDGVSVRGSSFTPDIGVEIKSSSRVVLQDLFMYGAQVGVRAVDVEGLQVTGSTFTRCVESGLSLEACDATISSCTMRECLGCGMLATDSMVSIDGLDIIASGGPGLRAEGCDLSAASLWTNATGGPGAWLEGGTADLTDPHIDAVGEIALLAEGDATVRCYNATVEVPRIVARGFAAVTLFHQARATVTLVDGRTPPASLRLVLVAATGAEAYNATLGRSASTGWAWLEMAAITPAGDEWRSPYTATVSFAGRTVTRTFEVSRRTDVTIELPHLLVASISVGTEVDEGVETRLDGTSSFSWPSELIALEWDIDYDGVFAPDGWGGRLWWTFAADGAHKVALRVTDGTGGSALAVVVVAVRDLGPTASIIPPPPGEVVEDAEVELDGEVTWVADPVDLISWDLGDGRVVEGSHPIVSWPRAGSYVVTFTAVDMDGSRATARAAMTVVNQPPVAVMPRVRLEAARHLPFALDGSRSHDTPSDMSSLRYWWVVERVGTFTGVRPNVTFDAVGEYRVTLTVTDDDGASSSAVMTVVVVNSPPLVGRLEDISMRRTDMPVELPLGRKVTDPDDDARNITVRAASSRPDLMGVSVRRQGDGTYVLTVTPVGTGEGTGRAVVTLTVTDGSGASAQGAFNVTLLRAPEAPSQATPAWVAPSLVLSLVLVLVAVVLLLGWARSRRAGPSDGGQ